MMRGSDALTATAIASGRTNSGFREQGPLCVCWERAGPGQTKGAFTQSDRCRRHGRLTQSRWSFPQQPMSRDWILPCQIRRPCHHNAWPSSVSISALALLEFVRRELFECGRCRVLSGAGHGVCGLWLPGWLEGCSAPTWSIIRLIT
jgi:hypothetical protein